MCHVSVLIVAFYFKVHVSDNARVPDHCYMYALSDSTDKDFKYKCKHKHDERCEQCESLDLTLKNIEQAIDECTFSSEEERDETLYLFTSAVRAINLWKGHQLRSVRQDQARLDVINLLKDEKTVYIVNDWAMKFLPHQYRESQSDWFGKKGISWHISVVFRKSNGQLESQGFIHIIESCSQDCAAIVLIMQHVLKTLETENPKLKRAFSRQDNAGCYHSASTILACHHIAKTTGIKISRIDFSDPQWGKGSADRLAATCKYHSYSTGRLPKSWKKADIVPIPKKKPISDVNKHLRPISLTSILSKIGEGFVVRDFVKPAVLKKIGNEQFGTVPKSSTTQALISMLHCWNKATDGSGSSVRVVLFDFKKAFDLIDHNILKRKLSNYDLPPCIVCWILDFLTDRKQRVKLSNDCYSEWGTVPAGVPQGTKLGPWLYLIMINTVGVADVDQWKYVDDTTVAETVLKNDVSAMQEYVEDLSNQSLANKFQLNETKCKELRISFAKFKPDFAPIRINDKDIEVVTSLKLLGLNISNDLKWNTHISEIVRKVSTRLYFLKQLKRAGLATKEMLLFYLSCVRPVTEYACHVFHNSLTKYLSDDLEKLQKRALGIIFPHIPYCDALEQAGLDSLYSRRDTLTKKLFNDIVQNTSHKLHALLPEENGSSMNLRRKNMFNYPVCKTNRFQNSFIMANVKEQYI